MNLDFKVLVIGHHDFPKGIKGMLEFVSGIEDIDIFKIDHNNSSETLKTDLNNYFLKNKHVLVLADLIGGAPHQVVHNLINETKNKNVLVIAGAGGSLMLDLVLKVKLLKVKNFNQLIEYIETKLIKQLNRFCLFSWIS